MILGMNFLSKTSIKHEYDSGHMQWYDSSLSMPPQKGFTCADFDNMEDMYHIYHIQFKDELLGQDFGAVCH